MSNPWNRGRVAGLVLVIGAAAYAGLVGGAGLTFEATPLAVGVVAVAAGLIGGRRRLVPIGLTVTGWGLAVLAVHQGTVPIDRQAQAYMIGTAVGLLAANAVARAWALAMTGALITVLSNGVAFYLAFEIGAVADWPLWAAVLATWGVLEAVRPDEPQPDESRPSRPGLRATGS